MFDILGVLLALIVVIAFALTMWSIIQTTFRLGIERGIEIERGEWNSVGDITRRPMMWGKQGKGKFGGTKS